MDGARFDGLTRALAARRSRRWATRGLMTLAGAWLALPRSAQAHYPGAAVPGGFCAAHDQCAPVAADVGWASCRGGVCCLVKGSSCIHDGECCDGEACLAPGVCGGAGASGLFPGAWCPAGGNACSTHPLLGPVSPVCADNGLWEDGPTNCCFPAGGHCGTDAECCAGLFCVADVCA